MEYCSYCGKKLKKNQDVCLSCGRNVNKFNKVNIFKIISGIISILLGIFIELYGEANVGFAMILAGILVMCSFKKTFLSIISGVLIILCSVALMTAYAVNVGELVMLGLGIANIVFNK